MKVWKQAIACIVVLIASAWLGYLYFPGAKELAAEWGIGNAPVSASSDSGSNLSQRSGAGAGPGGFGGRGGASAGIIIVEPIGSSVINDKLTAIGTGNAIHTVEVRPYSSGRLTELPVEPGSEVKQGDIIAQLDSESERIAVDRAELSLEDSKSKLERSEALRASNTVTAVQLRDAQMAVRNAELQLRDAKLALERRQIIAPISGIVGILPVSEGDYVTTSTDLANIDDRSEILVDFWIPERYARQVKVGAIITAQSVARPDESYQGVVRAIDNQVDATSRTLRVQGRISNPTDTLRSGMAFRVNMTFPGDQFPSINPLALQWSNDGAFVWAVRDGKALRIPVRVIQRNADKILIDGAFEAGDQVVVEGVHAVREGQQVLIANSHATREHAQDIPSNGMLR